MLFIFTFTLWLGLYLLSRRRQYYAALGLVSYSLSIMLTLLMPDYPQLATLRAAVLTLPALAWLGATLYLFPEVHPRTGWMINLAALVLFALTLIEPRATTVLPVIGILVALVNVIRLLRQPLPRPPLLVLLAATLFFTLGFSLMVVPVQWLSIDLILFALGFDLLLLGYVVAVLDAHQEGTRLLPEARRSLVAAALTALIFGGQVLLLNGSTALLLTVITTAVIWSTLSDLLQQGLDQLTLPAMQTERQQLRNAAGALPRVDTGFDFTTISEADFDKFTRKALSYYNDLNKLASSPLTRLPMITSDGILERTHELKALLKTCILQLKPDSDSDFGISDEWRYFNVLYYPYVLGVKPYRAPLDESLHIPRPVLDWFQTQVPERTLYNWQNTAARLVAQKLREMAKLAVNGSDSDGAGSNFKANVEASKVFKQEN